MLNLAQLIGHLGRDAELRYTQGGKAVASFSMATTEKWKDQQGRLQERTDWHRCVLWGKVAESLQTYLVKGKQVYVSGRIQTRQYDKDGQKHYATEIVVDQVRLLGGGNGNGSRREAAEDDAFGGGDDRLTKTNDDDIPF